MKEDKNIEFDFNKNKSLEFIFDNLVKYAEITNILAEKDIIFDGVVDGMVQTHHKDNPEYKLSQNPTWWEMASKEEIIDSIVSTFSK